MRSNHNCVTPFRIIQLQIINFKSATNGTVNNNNNNNNNIYLKSSIQTSSIDLK